MDSQVVSRVSEEDFEDENTIQDLELVYRTTCGDLKDNEITLKIFIVSESKKDATGRYYYILRFKQEGSNPEFFSEIKINEEILKKTNGTVDATMDRTYEAFVTANGVIEYKLDKPVEEFIESGGSKYHTRIIFIHFLSNPITEFNEVFMVIPSPLWKNYVESDDESDLSNDESDDESDESDNKFDNDLHTSDNPLSQ